MKKKKKIQKKKQLLRKLLKIYMNGKNNVKKN